MRKDPKGQSVPKEKTFPTDRRAREENVPRVTEDPCRAEIVRHLIRTVRDREIVRRATEENVLRAEAVYRLQVLRQHPLPAVIQEETINTRIRITTIKTMQESSPISAEIRKETTERIVIS